MRSSDCVSGARDADGATKDFLHDEQGRPASAGVCEIHPRFRTPYFATILTCSVAAVVAGLFPIGLLGELVNVGTLLAFAIVCAGILVLRRTKPDLERPFRTPWVPFVPIAGIVSCFALMLSLPVDTWLRLIVWLLIGLVVYFTYSRHHSLTRTK